MVIKKSGLCSSLWASCDELSSGMVASPYKGYVLFMLFIKNISDEYADSNDFTPPVIISKGAGFIDRVAIFQKLELDFSDNNRAEHEEVTQ